MSHQKQVASQFDKCYWTNLRVWRCVAQCADAPGSEAVSTHAPEYEYTHKEWADPVPDKHNPPPSQQ
eukprot:CAMPEP_0114546050 /NCGR_PEP_ID=MMETSP0114-20121206/3733_1 /TAXON_ID=31324 /ORGANISM="Goniomonas sp, Strain m" /LENGTH=66 /DNA_ID=CAMNT_0001730531 /DNA_START=861 /DNA_END=1061 /DNA_ORIENTATION=-